VPVFDRDGEPSTIRHVEPRCPAIPVTHNAQGVIDDVGAEPRHERQDFRIGGDNLTKALGRVRFAPKSCRGCR
jgi:hypothetical protein